MMVTAYALKVVPRKKLQRPHLVLQMRRERELLEFCKHPFILRCTGAYQNASFCYLLLDSSSVASFGRSCASTRS